MYIYRKTHSPLPVPWVWKYGLNSGMLLMRLDRMREFDFEKKIIETAAVPKYKESVVGDQDLLNILFHNQTGTERNKPNYIKNLLIYVFDFYI